MRTLITSLLLLGLMTQPAMADPLEQTATEEQIAQTIVVNKSPTCGCCKLWIEHLKAEGFLVEALDSDDMTAVKKRYAVPENMQSCHTAVIDGYVVEGHVPAREIRRLLEERPEAIGLAVPGMPLGSPGMEWGERFDAHKVMLFGDNGFSVFQDYPAPHEHDDEAATAASDEGAD
ncbi:MAG: DUF411 domain-containing protein [Woeseiaceae bacterium]